MDKDRLKQVYDKNIERINNADKWFKSHDPVDDDSKEYRLLLELIRETNKLFYELFVLGGESK
ncbi:MAG: hypothetical protein SO148_01095 [Candidatus Onthovivens sp.]|nr:hypothetical protein [Candidatus Onthovivens sp.]